MNGGGVLQNDKCVHAYHRTTANLLMITFVRIQEYKRICYPKIGCN